MKLSTWPWWIVCLGGLVVAVGLLSMDWAQAGRDNDSSKSKSSQRADDDDGDDEDEDDDARTFRFSKKDLGKVPKGWSVDKTGTGEGSEWKVVADKTAPSGTGCVLAQTAESATWKSKCASRQCEAWLTRAAASSGAIKTPTTTTSHG